MKRILFFMLTLLSVVAATACSSNDTQETPVETPPHTHTYDAKVTAPETCATDGIKTFTCSSCSDSYTETIAATGKHTYQEQITAQASCGNNGIKTFTCSGCNASYTETIAATGTHTYQESVNIPASCNNNGIKTFTCSGCNASYTEELPATGTHTYQEHIYTHANCNDIGITVFTCSGCGISYNETVYGSHKWTAATCTKAKTCTACGAKEGAPLGHTTKDGTCSRCGAIVTPKLTVRGHVEFAKHQGQMCSFDGPWDVWVSEANGDPYYYDADGMDLIFEDYIITPSDNPYVAGILDRPHLTEDWGMPVDYPPRTYSYEWSYQYISATDQLWVFTLSYNGKTFNSMTPEEFNAAGLQSYETGTWNGVRFIVSGASSWKYICYNLNDLAEYFGVSRRLTIVDGTDDFPYTHWVISE